MPIDPINLEVSMMENAPIEPEKLSLRVLLGMLSVGQLWKVMGAVIFVIVGAFGFGVWVVETFQLKPTSEELRDVKIENEQFVQQIEFLERSLSYLNARIKDKEDRLNNTGQLVDGARKQFILMLKRMYKGGDVNLQKDEGYEFDESEAGNHKIIFRNVKPYRIPQDVKGEFIEQLR